MTFALIDMKIEFPSNNPLFYTTNYIGAMMFESREAIGGGFMRFVNMSVEQNSSWLVEFANHTPTCLPRLRKLILTEDQFNVGSQSPSYLVKKKSCPNK